MLHSVLFRGTLFLKNFEYFYNYYRKQLRLGVERDIERQERRKTQNLYMLEQQRQLTKQLRQAQEREQLQIS